MKDIEAILAENGIPEDKREAVAKAVRENYRTIAEVTKKAERISELETANAELASKVGELEGEGEKLDELRKQVAEYRQAEEERKAKAAEDAKRDSFRALFENALDGREFANSIVRDAVFENAYAQCQTVGTGVREAIDAAVGDSDGVWMNPQTNAKKMPSASDVSKRKTDASEAKRSFAAALLG